MGMGSLGYPAHSRDRNYTNAHVRFTTNNTSNPDGVEDEDSVLAATSPLVYSATGIVTVTLRERWRKIVAFATIADTTAGSTVRQDAVVEGTAAANTVTLLQETAHVATATTDKVVDVILHLYR